jgi:3-(3-hydroxy-phenyl)propionate hydroxylase
VLIVDKNPAPLNLPRAISIDDEGCRTIAACGLAEPLRHILRPGTGSRYVDEAGRIVGEVGPGPVEYGWPRRNNFHQPELERVLRDGLARFDHVVLVDGAEMSGFVQDADGVTAMVSGKTVRASLMIAAEGARSQTRDALGIQMPGEAYPQDWIVMDLHRDDDQETVSKFFCDPARPWVSIPTTFGGRRYEFMLLPGETAEEMLKFEILQALLAPIRPLAAEDIMRAVVYRFEARIAERWGEGRVWLAGDAAHLTPPFAGQGMNSGIRDAHNLAWKAVLVAEGADPAILESYQAERLAPAKAMVQLAVAMGEVVMPVGQGKALFRDALMLGLERFPETRDFIIGMRFKPKPRYAQGLFFGMGAPDEPPASLIGAMLPNPKLADSWLDDQLGPGFALIAQTAECRAWLESADLSEWPVSIQAVFLPDDAWTTDPETYRPLRAHRDALMLVRPDKYVMAAFEPAAVGKVLSEMYRAFTNA